MASARPASASSGSEQETPDGQSHFVIPSPIDDCGDVPSPSQHRLPYASQRRQAGLDRMSDDQDQDDGPHSEEEEDGVEASNSSGGEESRKKKRRKKKVKTTMRRSKMVIRLKQRLHVRRRNSHRVTISLRSLCEICKKRSHICKLILGRLQLIRCPFRP